MVVVEEEEEGTAYLLSIKENTKHNTIDMKLIIWIMFYNLNLFSLPQPPSQLPF